MATSSESAFDPSSSCRYPCRPHPVSDDLQVLQRRVAELEEQARADARRLTELDARLGYHDAVVRRIRLQYEVAGILASAQTLNAALPRVLASIAASEQWDVAVAWVLSDGVLSKRYDWSQSLAEAALLLGERYMHRFDPGPSPSSARALKEGRLVWTSAPRSLRPVDAACPAFLGTVAIPLKAGDAIHGVLEFQREVAIEPDSDTCQLFEALGSDLGRFVEACQYESKLRQRTARLLEAQRIAQLAYWEWTPETARLTNAEDSGRVLGLKALDLPSTLDEYLALVPADQHERLRAAWARVLNPAIGALEVEHAIHARNGTTRIVLVRALSEFHGDGRPCKVSGTIQDVTEHRRAKAQAEDAERRWEAVFKNSPLPGIVTDATTGECLAANEEVLQWLGVPREEVVGRTTVELGIWVDSPARERIVARVREHGCLRHFEIVTKGRNGARNVIASMEHVELHGRACLLSQFVDITTRKQLEASLRLTAAAVEQSAEAMVILDSKGNILSVNPAFTRVTGYAEAEAVGRSLNVLLHQPTHRHDEAFFRHLADSLILHGHWEGEVWAMRKNGEVFPELLSLSVIRNEHERIVNHVAVFNDISDRKDYEDRLKKLALRDSLTGLPNRLLLAAQLEQTLERAQREKAWVAVLFIDLDRFKMVNDEHGHDTGDELLRQVAVRLQGSVRASDLVARLGGDEFVVVLPEISSSDDAALVAGKVVAALARPFAVGMLQLEVGGSVGVAMFPKDGQDAEVLLRHADEALYRVKSAGRNGFQFWK